MSWFWWLVILIAVYVVIKDALKNSSAANTTQRESFDVERFNRTTGKGETPVADRSPPKNRKQALNDWEAGLTTIWADNPITVEFTYISRSGKQRRTVDIQELQIDQKGRLYFIGHCHVCNENRSFNIENISTLIKVRSKRVDVYDFIDEYLGVEIADFQHY